MMHELVGDERAQVHVGWPLDQNLRVELEIAHRRADGPEAHAVKPWLKIGAEIEVDHFLGGRRKRHLTVLRADRAALQPNVGDTIRNPAKIGIAASKLHSDLGAPRRGDF